MILASHTLVILMKLFKDHFPDEHFHPNVFGSDSCERLSSCLRDFYLGKSNLCMLGIVGEAKIQRRFSERNSNVYDYRTGHTEWVKRGRE